MTEDTSSSASRQHFIDTGEYLKEGEAWTAAVPAAAQQITLPDSLMAGIKAIITSPDITPADAFVSTVILTFGWAFWEGQAEIDPTQIQLHEPQWLEICGMLTRLPGSDIDRVNYGLSWMNQGPSAWKE